MALAVSVPEQTRVKAGETAVITAEATGGTEPYAYTWKSGDKDLSGTSRTLQVVAKQSANGAKISVTVTDASDPKQEASAETMLHVEEQESDSESNLLLWEEKYAKRAAKGLTWVLVILLIPIFVLAFILLLGKERDFAGIVAIELVAVGAALGAAGVYMAVVELRGRAYTFDQLKQVHKGDDQADLAAIVKDLPKAIESFGKIGGRAAVLFTAIVCFVAAAWIGVTEADQSSGTTTTTVSTSTSTTMPTTTTLSPPTT